MAGVDGRTGVAAAPRFLTASLAAEIGILLALSALFPFMVHILPVPEEARLGPRLLPMFYAPLLAALLGRKGSAVLVAALAPWLNWLVTGYPAPRTAWVTTVQLLVFVLTLWGLLARGGGRWWLAIPAYLAGLTFIVLLAAAFPGILGNRPPLTWAVQTVVMGLPGLAVLTLINWLAVRHYPTGSDGQGPAAA